MEVSNITPRQLYLLRKASRYLYYSDWVGFGADLDTREETNVLPLPGIEIRCPDFLLTSLTVPACQVERCVVMLCCRYVPLCDDFMIITISLSMGDTAPNSACHSGLRHSP
jgi:hypothetical protein